MSQGYTIPRKIIVIGNDDSEILRKIAGLQTLKPEKKIMNIAIQHELDHLKGVLVCDKGTEI